MKTKRVRNRVVLAVTNDLSGDQRVHKVAMSLIKFGYKPVLVGRMLPGSMALSRPYECRRFKLLFNKGPLFYIAYNIRLLSYLLVARADQFLANDLDTLPAAFMAARIRGIRIVYDSHEYFTGVPELVDRPLTRRIWENIESLIFPRLKFVYTVNDSIARLYQSKYGNEVKVIRNVPSAFRPEPLKGKLPDGFDECPVIIYQGAVNVGRGLEEMIHALTRMPEFHLLIVGDGDIRRELQDVTEHLGLSERVCFTGKVAFDELPWYTRQADLGMSLEQDLGLNYHYALPNKLFDYMQAGIPVIASDLPEIRQIVEKEGFGVVVERFDPEYLSQTVKAMLSNPELLKSWRENALKAAPGYTWESEEKVLQDYFPALTVPLRP